VSVFAWRLFQNILPRGIYFDAGPFIRSLNCVLVVVVWWKQHIIYFWVTAFFVLFGYLFDIGLKLIQPIRWVLQIIFYSFSLSDYLKSRHSFMLLIWFASSWVIWKERNAGIFHDNENAPIQILVNIKLLSFWWLKAKFVVFSYQFHVWFQSLFLCLGIGYWFFGLMNFSCNY